MEQQFPLTQLPQTVPPKAAPQEPSVVTGAVEDAVALVLVLVLVLLLVLVAVLVEDKAGTLDELELALLHPDWQPVPQ
jgi:hypothetical protein